MAILVSGKPTFLDQLGGGLGTGFASGVEGRIEQDKKKELLAAEGREKAALLATQPPKEDTFTTESQKLAAKNVASFVTKLNENADASERILQSSADIRKAFDTGNVGFLTPRNIGRSVFGALGFNVAENADEAAVTAAGIPFLEKAKELFGRVTEGEVLILKDAIPTINDTLEGARAKADIWEKAAALSVKKRDLAQEIITENNGIAPKNLESLVNSSIKEERDALLNKAQRIGKGDFSEDSTSQNIPDGFIEITVDGQTGFVSPDQIEAMRSKGLNPQVANQEKQPQQAQQAQQIQQPQARQAQQPQARQNTPSTLLERNRQRQQNPLDSQLTSLLGISSNQDNSRQNLLRQVLGL